MKRTEVNDYGSFDNVLKMKIELNDSLERTELGDYCSFDSILNISVQTRATQIGSYALNGPKSIFLHRKLEIMRSNLIGQF